MKKIIILFSSFFLISCHHQQLSHKYLLQHPVELAHEVEYCYSTRQPDEAYCLMIKRTEEDFIGLSNVRQSNPEQFGQQILTSQRRLSELQIALQKAHEKFAPGAAELAAAELAYGEEVEKVNILLAVVRATSVKNDVEQ